MSHSLSSRDDEYEVIQIASNNSRLTLKFNNRTYINRKELKIPIEAQSKFLRGLGLRKSKAIKYCFRTYKI